MLINDISSHFPIFMITKYYMHKDFNRQYMYIGEEYINCQKKLRIDYMKKTGVV